MEISRCKDAAFGVFWVAGEGGWSERVAKTYRKTEKFVEFSKLTHVISRTHTKYT
jgi:hypothetical protein